MPLHHWRDLTTADFEDFDAQRDVALVPLGAIEQHGPHLPLSTDAVIAEEVAERAAAMAAERVRIIVLPCQNIGQSIEHVDFPGTLTAPTETLLQSWAAIGEGVHRAGLRKIVFLNAHGGQPQVMEIVVQDLRVRFGLFAVASSWWLMGLPDIGIDEEEIRHGIHGGLIETSMMQYLRPQHVRMTHAGNFRSVLPGLEARYEQLRLLGGVSAGWQAQDLHPLGVAGNAAAATPEMGAAIVDHVVARFATLLVEVSDYELENLEHRPA
ncbi:MAG: creatininase family protein [Gammaproteobacteria bacterium]